MISWLAELLLDNAVLHTVHISAIFGTFLSQWSAYSNVANSDIFGF